MRTESLQNTTPYARMALLLESFAASEGLTQEDAGGKLGIRRSSFARFTRDKKCVPRCLLAPVAESLANRLGVSIDEIMRFCEWTMPLPTKLLQLVATEYVQLRDRNTYQAAETLLRSWSDQAVTILAIDHFPPFVMPEQLRRCLVTSQATRCRSRSRARRSALMHRYIAPSFHGLLDRCELILPQSIWEDFQEGTGLFLGIAESCRLEFRDNLCEDLCRDGGLRIRILPDTEGSRAVLQHFAQSSVVAYIRGVGMWCEKADHTQVRLLKQPSVSLGVDLLKWDRQIIELARQLSSESLNDPVALLPNCCTVSLHANAA